MRLLRRLIIVAATAALAGGLAGPAAAADSATVDAEVSIIAPCLTVSTSAIDFGATLFSRPDVPWGATRSISYRDCSGSGEYIFGRATNASETGGGSGSWQLSASNLDCSDLGPNKFGLRVQSTTPFSETALLVVDQQLEHIGADALGSINTVLLRTPCTGSDGSGATMSFQIIFTASF